MKTIVLLFVLSTSFTLYSQERPSSKVDFDQFLTLSVEAGKQRLERLIPIETFNQYSREKNTIILDTRPVANYAHKHIAGAIHLNFSDFSEEKLYALIPDKSTRILIYCNNNFKGDVQDLAGKLPPLALNIPTYINLYGYGYKNVYELKDYLDVHDPLVVFSGTRHELK